MLSFSKRSKIMVEYKEFLRISDVNLEKLHGGKLIFG